MSDRDCENCKHHTEKGCDSWDCEFERKVTRKDVIKVFEDMKKGIYPYYPNVYLDIAINSLEIDERYELEYEQIEPCDDAISRQAVLDATVKKNSIWNKITNSKGENLEEIILQLPSVNPQDKYKKAAMDLLAEYLESEQSVISEFSGDFKKSAMMLKKRVMKYLKRLDESENTFNELVKDMWIAEYYEAESEGEHG